MIERVRQRGNKCAGVCRVSDLGHTAKIFCRVPQILAHGKHINFAVCPNLATQQNSMFAVCLHVAHGIDVNSPCA